jgi:hypothetical protein
MRAAQDQYFKGFRGRSDEMRKIGADGAKYPMTAPQYVDESTPQLGTLLDVMNAAGVASEAHTSAQIDGAFRELMVALALLVSGMVIVLGSIWVVVVRVTASAVGALDRGAAACRQRHDGRDSGDGPP